MVIGLVGLSLDSGKIGCAVLAFSFYAGLIQILKAKKKQVEFGSSSVKHSNLKDYADKEYSISFVEYHHLNTKSAMAVFKGDCMHATIGEFLSDGFTISFASSRKFHGYYDNLKYLVLVDERYLTTEHAVYNTLEYIEGCNEYKTIQSDSRLRGFYCFDEFYQIIDTKIQR